MIWGTVHLGLCPFLFFFFLIWIVIDHFTFSEFGLGDYAYMMLVMMELNLLTGERNQIKQKEKRRKEDKVASLI